jgi:hypothetical protein
MAKRKPGATTREREARTVLLEAIDAAGYARGMAQWVNGYRTAGKDSNDIWVKERSWWKQVTTREAAIERALAAYRRAIKAVAQ